MAGNCMRDKIDLHDMDANTQVAFDQAFSFVGSAGFSGAAGKLRFSDGVLSGDHDGDGIADFFVQVTGGALRADDFML